jgi:uncharacterized protein (TIGR03437 family)
MPLRLFLSLSLFVLAGPSVASAATPINCTPAAAYPLIHSEGITERIGDIVFYCSGGSAGALITGNLSVSLNVNITNRVAGNDVTDVVFTIDNGSGPQPAGVPGMIAGPGLLVYSGLSFTLSPAGGVVLRLANIRAAANQVTPGFASSVVAVLSFDNALLSTNLVQSGNPTRGLYAGYSAKIICGPQGSPLPKNPASFQSFQASGTVFTSTRLTEGFDSAFDQLSVFQSMNADSGTRVIVGYSGFPAGARLFVPNVVAGSDALQPTAGGDLGMPAAGGKYAPGPSGSLLLSLVQNTDANGAGGSPVYAPGPAGSGTVSFDAMSEVMLTGGVGFAVYEVMDANASIQESAQFPTFLALAPFSGSAVETSEDVSLAPTSTVTVATAADPIPRFQKQSAPPDCTIVGDCGASYFPRLFVAESSLEFTAKAGSNYQVNYIQIQNRSGGVMQWTSTLNYLNGSGWLRLDPTDGLNDVGIRVDALPGTLAPGTYNAILTIDAGPLAGSRQVSITLVITPATAPQPPLVNSAVNGATSALGSRTTTQLIVTVGGLSSAPMAVALAAFAPGIFANGVLNRDYSVNSPSHPTALGSTIQIFATGLSGDGAITAKIADRVVDQPAYAGPAPGLLGVQQVNLHVPTDLTGTSTNVEICGRATSGQVTCSPAVAVALKN